MSSFSCGQRAGVVRPLVRYVPCSVNAVEAEAVGKGPRERNVPLVTSQQHMAIFHDTNGLHILKALTEVTWVLFVCSFFF